MAFIFVCAAELIRRRASALLPRGSAPATADKHVLRWLLASGWFFEWRVSCQSVVRFEHFIRLIGGRIQTSRPSNALAALGHALALQFALSPLQQPELHQHESAATVHGWACTSIRASLQHDPILELRPAPSAATGNAQLRACGVSAVLICAFDATNVSWPPSHFIHGRPDGATISPSTTHHAVKRTAASTGAEPAIPAALNRHDWADCASWHEATCDGDAMGR